MTISKFLTGGAWAAMAAALVFTSMPASAREKNGRENLGREWNDRGAQRAERQAARNTARQQPQREQRRATPPARQVPSAPAVQRGGNRAEATQRRGGNRAEAAPRRSGNRTDAAQQRGGGNWNRGDRPGGTANRGDRRTDGARQQGGSRGWARPDGASRGTVTRNDRGAVSSSDRNRSYTDSNRNRTYDGRRGNDRNWSGNRRDNDRNRGNRNGSYRDGSRDARREHRRWDNRSWRNDRRYDWQRHRASNRHAYHLGRYYAPYRNYSYRRFSIGVRLDSLFYTNRYWINDPWRYRLPAVYGPYRWVRYYDDALLVDVYSGEVVDVIHDFFW